ncbi:MAG: CRISPR-associated endonuclease Cas2, partial [Candidatus Staskawiczbacteria bacterium RIFCSPHIGHO2_01_FULL_36_16]
LKSSFKFSETRKRRKDGKYIMLIFDVPVKNIKARNLLRSVLQNLGYKLFQQSVWICPFDVFEKTEKLLQMYSLEKYVKLFLIEEL